MRLDLYIASKLNISREKARTMIVAGEIMIGGTPVIKPSLEVTGETEITVGSLPKYVGRGGLKLERALEVFRIDVDGLTCLDVGASTGGFTDCLLQRRAGRVYAVENGSGQLAPSLAWNTRVISLENTDIRDEQLKNLIPPVDFAGVDVSFISLRLVAKSVFELMKENSEAVFLVKPQFEAGREHLSKNGLVRHQKTHIQVLENIIMHVKLINFAVKNITFSPITGGEGNIEYLLHLKKGPGVEPLIFTPEEIVKEAFKTLRKG